MKRELITTYSHVVEKIRSLFVPTHEEMLIPDEDDLTTASRGQKRDYIHLVDSITDDHVVTTQADSQRPLKWARTDMTVDACGLPDVKSSEVAHNAGDQHQLYSLSNNSSGEEDVMGRGMDNLCFVSNNGDSMETRGDSEVLACN